MQEKTCSLLKLEYNKWTCYEFSVVDNTSLAIEVEKDYLLKWEKVAKFDPCPPPPPPPPQKKQNTTKQNKNKNKKKHLEKGRSFQKPRF